MNISYYIYVYDTVYSCFISDMQFKTILILCATWRLGSAKAQEIGGLDGQKPTPMATSRITTWRHVKTTHQFMNQSRILMSWFVERRNAQAHNPKCRIPPRH